MLSIETALIFNTSDTPEEREKTVLGDPLHLIWQNCVLLPYCGVDRVERRMFGAIAGSELKERQTWLDEVTSLSILAAVARRPLHGYAILGTVDDLCEGRVKLRAGTLYAALDRLVRESALIVDSETIVDGRLRRSYRITASGRQMLRTSAERFEANAAVAWTQLAGRVKS